MRMRAKEVIKLEELKVTPRTPAWVTGQLKLPITVEKKQRRERRTAVQKFQGFYTIGVSQICSDN